MKKKRLAATVLFLALAGGMLGGLSWLLRDRETTLAGFYSEPKNSVDVLIVGSSHVNNGYAPALLWGEYGISAYNVYSWSQPMWISYHYIREALRTQKPRAIVLEMFGMTYGHSYIMPEEIDRTSYANSFNIDETLNYYEMLGTVKRCGLDLRKPADFLNLPRYHTRWKNLSARMFTYDPHQQPDYLRGYGLNFALAPREQPDFALPAQSLEPYEYAVEYLHKIVALCRQKNIPLIFALTPYSYTQDEAGIFRWLTDYAAQQGIPFLNYNGADGKRVGIDFAADLGDVGHLNYYGAVKVTRDLGAYLSAHVDLPAPETKRNRAALDKSAAQFGRTIAVAQVMTQPDPAAWFDAVRSDPDYALMLYVPELSALPEPVRAALGRCGAQPGAQGAYGMMWVPDEGLRADVPFPWQRDFAMFGKPGTVAFTDGESGGIALNGEPAPHIGGTFQAVLYDRVLERPLEVVGLDDKNPAVLVHREFTSDILPRYRR